MDLTSGQKLGPYAVIDLVGAGGMGEVYRASDSRLGRKVALKVLPREFSGDSERMARFSREAQVLASLNHHNIASIYGIEDSDGMRALIMELVEGPTLADRIKKGPLSLKDGLGIAHQIGEGLEYAHERGIVHRDLKPANIKLTADGNVKILDFGLAKALVGEPAAGIPDSPTVTAAATQPGSIIGTPAYMPPEQAEGKSTGKPADIWAFGAVLYEILSRKRAFGGETVNAVLAAVIRAEPDWSALPADTPPMIRRLLRRCLEKDEKRRFRDIGAVRMGIEDVLAELALGSEAAAASTPPTYQSAWRHLLPWGVVAIFLMIAAVSLITYWRAAPAASGPTWLSFVPPPNLGFNDTQPDTLVVSPDGQKLAFTARSPEGKWLIWVRPINSPDTQPLPGTDDAIEPFWSPDSRSIAFGSQGKLKRVDLAGGTAQILCNAGRLTGGTWSSDGVIVFGPDYRTSLFLVPATGGEPKPVTFKDEARGDNQHSTPKFLPDGKHFIFKIGSRDRQGIWVGSLDSPQVKQILTDNTNAVYVTPGWLLYLRNQILVAQAFDANRLELRGDPIPIMTHPAGTGGGGPLFSASENGVLVWQDVWVRDYQLAWFDRSGKQTGVVGPVVNQTREGQEPRISPDGKRVVIKRDNNIWVIDLTRDTGIRLTSVFTQLPIWSPDGSKVAFLNNDGLILMAADGVGQQELLLQGFNLPDDWSSDGRFLFFVRRADKTREDIWVLPFFGDKKEYPVLDSAFDEEGPRLSPDGHWLAYTSDESGSYEVYVRSFTADGKVGSDKKRISTNGGAHPAWCRDGQELFYLAADYQMMSVAVKTGGAEFEFSAPNALFKMRTLTYSRLSSLYGLYDVMADGKRFLVGTLVGESKVPPPTVILNWDAGLKR